jgi:hypothetical protein
VPNSKPLIAIVVLAIIASAAAAIAFAQYSSYQERWRQKSGQRDAAHLAEPFRGISLSGETTAGLFPLRSTGVPTTKVRKSVAAFLATLRDEQRQATLFDVDDDEWRRWNNMHAYYRQGVSLDELNADQREAAMTFLGASLSPKGLQLSRDIMRLNHTLGELKNDDFQQYGEGLYWITVMGEPSETEPWGWQLDGHHLNINYFVIGDQVVMSPVFVGSEPVIATAGKFAGVEILQMEQNKGLQLIRYLSDEQRERAIVKSDKDNVNLVAGAFRDNMNLDYAGVPVATFSAAQKKRLLELVSLFVGNLREEHATVRLAEIEEHLDQTWFAWVGGTKNDSVYYYRIMSPVILIEFDHMMPVGLRHLYPRAPTRQHIHVMMRTPNGNDYGKDLLRQHYETHPHHSH